MDKCDAPISDESSLAQALAKLNEAMRPSLGGRTDPARRRGAQRLAQLARCEDEDLPAFAKRHMPGRTVEESGLRSARDLLLAIGGIADMEEGGPDAWAALAEVNRILERRLAEAKEAALKRKAEAEEAAAGPPPHVAPMLSQRMPAPLASPTPPLADATLPPTRLPPAPGALPFASTTSPLPFAARAGWDRPTPPSSAPRYDSVLPFRPPPSPAVAPREERASMAPELASWRAPPQPAWAAPSSGPGAAASIPPLTLEQYAGMVVACELYPLHAQSTQSRYGVRTPDERAALDRFWHARLSADPVLAEHWERMRENARRYFRQAP
ncbi:hypothetical protein WME75_05140 [Sorangium sp. So ce1014]|uniref:hypothetical protein n=1 Tax=Sorangium sp. So ce1014 TaxID=3133326 RepID=UPI003F60985B